MQNERHSARHALCALGLLLSGAACHHSHDDGHVTPVFRESEPNDDAFEADYFGVLRPGERFFIDGHISDTGFDPFDGFAFVAGEPVHVDFRLFQADPTTDFDVCLYDPQLDQTVACFATSDDPEAGGADITAGGTEFHLVVESFVGSGAYSLEIEVYHLFPREASAGSTVRGSTTSGARTPRAIAGYGRGSEATATTLRIVSVDEGTGVVTETAEVSQP